MKTNELVVENQFNAIKYQREQRDILTDKLLKMSKSEIIDYFQSQRIQNNLKPCSK